MATIKGEWIIKSYGPEQHKVVDTRLDKVIAEFKSHDNAIEYCDIHKEHCAGEGFGNYYSEEAINILKAQYYVKRLNVYKQ